MGFPVLLKATSGDSGAAGGVVILAVTLTRAPLLVPLTAMQGNLIAHFVDQRSTPAAGPGGAGRVLVGRGRRGRGRAGRGRLGPWLLRSGVRLASIWPSGALLAWFTAAAVAIALLTLTGAATVAAALHRAYAAGWVVRHAGLGRCCCCCRWRWRPAPWSALLCGPLVGIAVHLVALARVPAA